MKRRQGARKEGTPRLLLTLKRMGCLMLHGRLWMERSVEFIAKTISRVREVGQRDSSDTTPIIIAEYNTGEL